MTLPATDPSTEDRVRGTLLGLATADALGAPLEFQQPAEARTAVERGLAMCGGGGWEPGEWTDDTAMALSLAESIAEHGLLDLDDVCLRYIAWANSGPKDIGNITRDALVGASGRASGPGVVTNELGSRPATAR